MNRILSSSTLILSALVFSANVFAEDQRAMMKTENSESPAAIITRSANVYSNLTRAGTKLPESVVSKAQCVAVIPQTVTAAIVVGGTHGDGIATCRTKDGKWSSPAFVDLNAASLGAQAGGKESDIVLFFTSAASANALKAGKIELGADASVVAGNFERNFDSNTASVIAYQSTSGAFIGASIAGGRLSSSDQSNKAYYGKTVTVNDILNGTESAPAANREAADALLRQLPA